MDGIPLRLRQLQERRTRKDSGVVDECVEPAERSVSFRDDTLRLAAGGDAALHQHSPASEGLNFGRCCLRGWLVVEPVDGNVGASASECEGAGPPDALLGAGDQNASSFKIQLHEIALGLGVVRLVSGAARSYARDDGVLFECKYQGYLAGVKG